MKHILSFKEKIILEDILSPLILLENNGTINESVFQKVLDKVKSYAKSGVLSTALLAGLLATPGLSNAQQDEIKKIDWNKMIDKTSEVVKKTGDEIKRRVDDKDFWGTKQGKESQDTIDNNKKDIDKIESDRNYQKTLSEYQEIADKNGYILGIGQSMDYNISNKLAQDNGRSKLRNNKVESIYLKKSITIPVENEDGNIIYKTIILLSN